MWTSAFWKGLGERAIKTFFQSGVAAVATLGIQTGVGGVESVNWWSVGSVALLATILSVGTSIGNVSFTSGAQDALIVNTPPDKIPTIAPVGNETPEEATPEAVDSGL